MLLKKENPVLTLNTEESLDNCIKLLESLDSLESCSLHFAIDNLPSEKIVYLAELIKKQTKLDTLILSAKVSKDSCENYAIILEKIFIDLSHLRVLTFRGLSSEYTSSTLINLIENTKTLTQLSVGALDEWQDCYPIAELDSAPLAKALEQNTTLTHLNLRGNRLKQSGIAMIINNLSSNTPLKVLKLSKNFSVRTGDSYNVEGMFELLDRHDTLEEIETEGIVITPLNFVYHIKNNKQAYVPT